MKPHRHRWKTEYRRGYTKPMTVESSRGNIAFDTTQRRLTCSRWLCSTTTEWETIRSTGIQSLTLDRQSFDVLEITGTLWVKRWKGGPQ